MSIWLQINICISSASLSKLDQRCLKPQNILVFIWRHGDIPKYTMQQNLTTSASLICNTLNVSEFHERLLAQMCLFVCLFCFAFYSIKTVLTVHIIGIKPAQDSSIYCICINTVKWTLMQHINISKAGMSGCWLIFTAVILKY